MHGGNSWAPGVVLGVTIQGDWADGVASREGGVEGAGRGEGVLQRDVYTGRARGGVI